jgi:hypothetical protein
MMRFRIICVSILGIATGLCGGVPVHGASAELLSPSILQTGHSAAAQEPVFDELPGFKKRCLIGTDYYFIYQFDKTPKMGMAVLKIALYDKKGKRTTELDISGRLDMPSMRGAHDSGEVPFKLNAKGDYLLPVNIVMPGDWEVRLVFNKGDSVVYRARLNFSV